MEEKEGKKLEFKVLACSHMIWNLKNLRLTPYSIAILLQGYKRIDLGQIRLKSEDDVVCDLTKQSCVLYDSGSGEPFTGFLVAHRLIHCPPSKAKDLVRTYELDVTKKDGRIIH